MAIIAPVTASFLWSITHQDNTLHEISHTYLESTWVALQSECMRLLI